jgi:hypothetical protein
MDAKPANWTTMTPDQKRAHRLELFRQSGEKINFVNPQAKENYNKRVKRLIDVYNLNIPDRVPLSLSAGNLPVTMAGLTLWHAFYEPQKAVEAALKFNQEYSRELELFAVPNAGSGEALEQLDYKLYAWPGHGLPRTADGWQFIEGEYMSADEYDDLIRDPSDFWLRKYLPRVFGAFEGFGLFQPFTNITENVNVPSLTTLGLPPVQQSFQKLLNAGLAFHKNAAALSGLANLSLTWGFPVTRGGFCKAPFDTLGDTLRGTLNIMKDMYQRPEKLLKALDVITDISINNVLKSPNIDNIYMLTYPLHKGADGWMSQAQFNKFYWPQLKRMMDAFIKEGIIQSLFAEGGYNSRLNYVNQFPRGSVVWIFDRTDMAEAKRILGKDCALMGNIPASMICTSQPSDVKTYCRQLIETAGKDGGFILAPGASAQNPRLDNLRAIVAAVNEYGYYQK